MNKNCLRFKLDSEPDVLKRRIRSKKVLIPNNFEKQVNKNCLRFKLDSEPGVLKRRIRSKKVLIPNNYYKFTFNDTKAQYLLPVESVYLRCFCFRYYYINITLLQFCS